MTAGFQAGAAYSIYRIDRTGFDQDIDHILRQYDRVTQRAKEPLPGPRLPATPGVPAGGGVDGTTIGVDKAAAQAALSQQRLEAATQRTAAAQGRAAVEAQRLATEEQRTAAATSQAAAAASRAELSALRLGQAQAKAAQQASQAASGATRYAQQFGAAFQSSLLGIVGPAAAAAAAIGAVKGAGELVQLGAQANQTRGAFDNLAKQAGMTGDALLGALRKASSGTISDLNLELAANRAQLLGVAHSAQEFSVLMGIARDRAQKMGISTQYAFDSLVTGLGRGSALILDNLGITLSVTEANKAYAASIGKTAAQLTEAEQKQALINAVLTQGQASIAATGGAMDSSAASIERFGAAWDNLKAKIGGAGAQAFAPVISDLASALDGDLTPAYQQLTGVVRGSYAGQAAMLATLIQTGDATKAQTNYFLQLLTQIALATGAVSQHNAAVQQSAPAISYQSSAMIEATTAAAAHSVALTDDRSQIIATYQATGTYAQQQLQAAQTGYDWTNALLNQSQGLAENTAKTLESQIQAQKLTGFQAALAQLGGAVAAGHMTAGNAALLLAQKYNIASQEAGRLIALQAQIAGAQVRAARQGGLSVSERMESSQLAVLGQQYQQIKNDQEIAKAKEEQTLAVGSAVQQQAIYNRRLQEAIKLHGADSAEAIRAETDLKRFQNSQARGGRGGGGGGVKLTDQERLNNKLLSNQDAYENKAEDEARRHTDNLIKIERDYATKSQEQQRQNEVSKRQDRYEFYRSLAQAGKDLGEGEAQAYSAAYEQAFAESQALAQNGQNKLAADRLALRRKQIQEDIDAAKAIRKAEQDGDSEQAESLRALETLRKDSQAEELKQLEARGDAIANDRAKALADEQTRFDAANAQNEQSATRKADSVVTAAEREKKAIGGVNDMLAKQNDLYARSPARPVAIGEPAATSTPASSAPAPATAPAAAPASAGAAAAGLMAVFDAAVVSAIEGQTATLGGKLDQVVDRLRAVEGAIGRPSGGFQ